MRLCCFLQDGKPRVGAYFDETIIDLTALANVAGLEAPAEPLDLLGPGSVALDRHAKLADRLKRLSVDEKTKFTRNTADLKLRAPIARPSKLFMLAGNYNEHITEGGGRAVEQKETFPYVFMKPLTTINHPGGPVVIPRCSPDHIDWELEIAVVIGARCRGIQATDAPNYIAGYTIVNDVSDRQFRPNPGRKQREKDAFFDWLHGKWHDTFAPMGPCITPTGEIGDVQNLHMTLRVDGQVEQDSSTSKMIFSVNDIVAFLSTWVTLDRGDVISTGTPGGVGAGKGKFLRPGQKIEATIQNIGTLVNPVVAE